MLIDLVETVNLWQSCLDCHARMWTFHLHPLHDYTTPHWTFNTLNIFLNVLEYKWILIFKFAWLMQSTVGSLLPASNFGNTSIKDSMGSGAYTTSIVAETMVFYDLEGIPMPEQVHHQPLFFTMDCWFKFTLVLMGVGGVSSQWFNKNNPTSLNPEGICPGKEALNYPNQWITCPMLVVCDMRYWPQWHGG